MVDVFSVSLAKAINVLHWTCWWGALCAVLPACISFQSYHDREYRSVGNIRADIVTAGVPMVRHRLICSPARLLLLGSFLNAKAAPGLSLLLDRYVLTVIRATSDRFLMR